MNAENVSADPRAGMVLQDRYRIVRRLGGGGMGTVYEAQHLLIQKRVAIKALHPQFAAEKEMVERFRREAQAATTIGHPNIVEVNDIGTFPDGTPFMVLEFLEGRDWAHDLRDQGAQPLSKVVDILSQVCDALGVAHAIGIVHRDMKPENIFLTERGGGHFVKVVDFGISKMFDRAETGLTETGTTLGTPNYMSPEQCQGMKDLDGRTDIYALGVIMFKALTGQYPFDDASYPMLVLKICTEHAPQIAEYRSDLPAGLQAVLDRMLAKRREDRFATCSQLKAALEPFRQHAAAPALVANALPPSSRGPSVLAAKPRSKSRAWLLLGGAGFVLAMAVAFVGVVVLSAMSREEEVRPPPIAASHSDVAPPPPPEPEPVAAQAPPPPPIEAPQAPATVHVRIAATPIEARMTLDGDPLPNPFDADVPRDADPEPGQERQYHLLRVEAPGYRTHEQQLVFRFDNMSYPIELQRGRADNVVRVSADGAVQQPARIEPSRAQVQQPVRSQERQSIFNNGQPSGPSTVPRTSIFR
jgi:serine/threonine protein kinase